MQRRKSFSVKKMAIIGMLGAISMILGLTPLGFIPIGPTRATIMHVPVIIGAIVEGPVVGALVGLIFGLFSMFQAFTNPTVTSFVFYNPIVALLPRVLIGITSYYSYVALKKVGKRTSKVILVLVWLSSLVYLVNKTYANFTAGNAEMFVKVIEVVLIVLVIGMGIFLYKKFEENVLEVVVATGIGTLTNTIGVLFLIYVFYAQQFVEKLGASTESAAKVIATIGLTNGIPEVIVAMLIVSGVVVGLKKK